MQADGLVSKSIDEVLLSGQFLREHKCTWDFRTNAVTLKGHTFQLCDRPRKHSSVRVVTATRLQETEDLPQERPAGLSESSWIRDPTTDDNAVTADGNSTLPTSPPAPRRQPKRPAENNDDCEVDEKDDVRVETRLRPAEERRAPARHDDYVRY